MAAMPVLYVKTARASYYAFVRAIACDGDAGLTVDTAAGTASFATVGGQTTTCTFTNNQAGQINVVKDGDGAVDGPFEFATSYG